MASIVFIGGEVKEVKNLGWIIKHLSLVHTVSVYPTENKGAKVIFWLEGTERKFSSFHAKFASFSVLKDWLKARRNLQGVMCHVVTDDLSVNVPCEQL